MVGGRRGSSLGLGLGLCLCLSIEHGESRGWLHDLCPGLGIVRAGRRA